MIGPASSPLQVSSPPDSAVGPDAVGPDVGRSIGDPGGRSQAGLVLLALLAALPALAFLPGLADGRHGFTLYREPKLLVAQLLLWSLLATLAWQRRSPWPPGALRGTFARPVMVLWGLFLLWAAATAGWALVPANAVYELLQLVPLTALLAVLVAWGRSDPRVARATVGGLVASLAVATAVGLLQLVVEIPWLPPIDPQYGVANPSLMGYKNPMALALLGQIFLLAWACTGPGRWRWPLRVLLAVELAYLATLQSRTATFALLAGGLLLGGLALARWRRERRRGSGRGPAARAAAWAGAALLLFLAVGLLHPGGRQRIGSAAAYLAAPASFLDSDRGVYLRNTLNMVRHRPLGVGLGDWQTHYPVYRRHDRFRAFTDRFQVRRAHSDHVQVLGETGWPGLVLWLAFLAAVIGAALRRFLAASDRDGGDGNDGDAQAGNDRVGDDRLALFAGVQVAVLVLAMATDYVIEMPYHRLQLFLAVAVALIAAGDGGRAAATTRRGPIRRYDPQRRPSGGTPVAVATTVTAAGLLVCAWTASSLVRDIHAAALESHWTALVHPASGTLRVGSLDDPEVRRELSRLDRDATTFLATPGHTKTQYRDHLLLSHLALLLDRRPLAERRARRALESHPHHPNTFRLLAEIHGDDPARAGVYRRTWRFLMRRAESGLVPPVPPGGVGSDPAADPARAVGAADRSARFANPSMLQ